jgi:uncharacterized protein (DUF433 family)
MDYSSVITLDTLPCIRGSRITADEILRHLVSGATETEILARFPNLTHEDIRACAAFRGDREKLLESHREAGIEENEEMDAALRQVEKILLKPTLTIPKQRIPCPRCGKELWKNDSQSSPHYCFSCKTYTNREGFLVEQEVEYIKSGIMNWPKFRQVTEIGKGRQIIWEYIDVGDGKPTDNSELVMPLLRTIQELESKKQALGKAVDTKEGLDVAWNLKRAKRRFIRWYDEIERRALQIPDPVLRDLAAKLIEKKDEDPIDQFEMDQILSAEFTPQTMRWDALREYEYRKRTEPLLFFADLPDKFRRPLTEAQEAWRWGLFRSVIALCRLVLDAATKKLGPGLREMAANADLGIELRKWAEHSVEKLDETDLNSRLNSLPPEIAIPEFLSIAHKIRVQGNTKLHEMSEVQEEEAEEALTETTAVVQYLLAPRLLELAAKRSEMRGKT